MKKLRARTSLYELAAFASGVHREDGQQREEQEDCKVSFHACILYRCVYDGLKKLLTTSKRFCKAAGLLSDSCFQER